MRENTSTASVMAAPVTASGSPTLYYLPLFLARRLCAIQPAIRQATINCTSGWKRQSYCYNSGSSRESLPSSPRPWPLPLAPRRWTLPAQKEHSAFAILPPLQQVLRQAQDGGQGVAAALGLASSRRHVSDADLAEQVSDQFGANGIPYPTYTDEILVVRLKVLCHTCPEHPTMKAAFNQLCQLEQGAIKTHQVAIGRQRKIKVRSAVQPTINGFLIQTPNVSRCEKV